MQPLAKNGKMSHPPGKNGSDLGVALLTGGGDKPYVLGLASTLGGLGILVDFIGSDDLDVPEVRRMSNVNFQNLRGDQRSEAGLGRKVTRILRYYLRLFHYAATAQPKIFHIIWNNKFEFFDRTLLMLYYKMLGRRIAFTAHNVNAGKRDGRDSRLNRMTLKLQYQLADHIFVHTEKMKGQLAEEFAVPQNKVSVIPLGVNNTVPSTSLTSADAKRRLGLGVEEKVLLFYGRIAPYKGLEYLIAALGEVSKVDGNYRLIIAGSVKSGDEYWQSIEREIDSRGLRERILQRIEFIPDEETELYFKAADVLMLPYTEIFQSGVLILAYSFGLPVIASDVGAMRDDIIEGATGYVIRPKDPSDCAEKLKIYFSSPLYRELESRRQAIQNHANSRFSWAKVGEVTKDVYLRLLNGEKAA